MKSGLFASAAALALLSGTAFAQDLKFPIGEGAFNWQSLADFDAKYDLAGQKITVLGPWLGPDQELVSTVIAYFEQATGADVEYIGAEGFEQQVVIDAEAGSPPDVAVFPQPGLLMGMAAKGQVLPMTSEIVDWTKANYAAGQSWVDLVSSDAGTFGFFYKVDVKSLVWYSPENFEDAGYAVPESMEDLKALTDQIVADGGTPWCIGLGSGGATGWPATDWVEDMMLRTTTPENYDAWVKNDMKFNDPIVVAAIDEYGAFAKNDAYVAGGAGAVASTDFRDSPKGLFTSPPQCYMHRQASFIPSFFPEGTVAGEDSDFFYFPSYAGKDLGKPVLGAGTVFGLMKESDAGRAFIDYLTTPIAHEIWMAQTGFLTPHKGANTELYGDATQKKLNDILLNATTFRFDGSDLMPGGIGAGVFWTGMVDYTGGKSAQEVADSIQGTWDSLK